jgi:hypothetical protein
MKLSLQRLERLNLKEELYLRRRDFEESKMVFRYKQIGIPLAKLLWYN